MATTFEWRAARDSPPVRRMLRTSGAVASLWLLYGGWTLVRGDEVLATAVWVLLGVASGAFAILQRRAMLRLDGAGVAWRGPFRGGELAWDELSAISLAWRDGWTLLATTRDERSVGISREALRGLEDAGSTKLDFIARLEERAAAAGFSLELANFPESGDDATSP